MLCRVILRISCCLRVVFCTSHFGMVSLNLALYTLFATCFSLNFSSIFTKNIFDKRLTLTSKNIKIQEQQKTLKFL